MAREIRQFSVTIPAGTLQAANFTTRCKFPPREVDQINITVPPGPRGNMGFQIAMGDTPVFPSNGGYVATDNRVIEWPLAGQPNSGDWSVIGYNNGQYDHTVIVEFLLSIVDNTPASAVPGPPPVVGLEVSQ